MTNNEIDQINALRLNGYGPTRISQELGISINTITSYLKRHPIPPGLSVCKQCGALLKQTPGRRPRKFCSSKCKNAWWNARRHEGERNVVVKACARCGKEFRSYESDNRKYCSQECYRAARRSTNSD